MADTLIHRGPDDAGVWVDEHVGLALGHRRLAILDLSPAGHQPMVSASGRYVIAFNGEIYNHLALRDDLQKVGAGGTAPIHWRGHSDTETLLAAFEAWGIETTLQKAVGMFAIALWDRETSTLTLARDPVWAKNSSTIAAGVAEIRRLAWQTTRYGLWAGVAILSLLPSRLLRVVRRFRHPIVR
jgi:asparagine synthase (glutamine-hydrolysing)